MIHHLAGPRFLALSGLIFLLVWLWSGSGLSATVKPKPPTSETSAESVWSNLSLEARAALVVDLNTGQELFALAPETQLPIASITKVMTAWLAAERLAPQRQVLVNNTKWQAQDLLAFTLVTSFNEGAAVLANVTAAGDKDFVQMMNDEATRLGLSQTYFLNPSGLDQNVYHAGAYSSVRDVATLLGHVLGHRPELLRSTRLANFNGGDNTNALVSRLPGLVAGKTGFTDLAHGNLVVVFDRGLNQPVAVVVLASSLEGRFRDVARLVEATQRYYTSPGLRTGKTIL